MLKQDSNQIWINKGSSYAVSYPENGNEEFFKIEQDSFWFNHRNNVLVDVLQRYPFMGNFADIGGGNGFQVQQLSTVYTEKEIYLIEPNYSGCLNARKRGLEHVFNIPAEEFPFCKKEIGGIGLFDVIEHIEDEKAFLRTITERIGPGTRMYLSVPAYSSLWSDSDVYAGHYRRYNREQLIQLANELNLKVLGSSYYFSYLVIPLFLFRRLPYLMGRKREESTIIESETRQHHSSGPGRIILETLNRWERNRIRTKKISTGTSCIMVVEKVHENTL